MEDLLLTINLIIVVPILAALLIPIIHKKLPHIHLGWFVLAVPVILFITITHYIPPIVRGETFLYTIEWIPSYGINLTTYFDGLSMIFGLLITGIGSLVILYSIYYLSTKESLQHFYIYLLLFMGAMLGVVFSDNIMILYLFWELTSISSFLLIAFWYHRKQSRYGAQKSLLITVSGGIAMLISFIMLYTITGTFSIREIINGISLHVEHVLFLPAMLLLLLGAFTKSAQFPFHIWLPNAMEAPTPVSAYLHSATMVKAGIYLVARFTPVFGGEAVWFWVISIVGIITLFWGSFSAVRQTDLKALLAYSTVSQLGLVMSLLGFGSVALSLGLNAEAVIYTQATFAALFHLVNHSTFKCALFMVVGIIDLKIGTRDIRRLGGLMALMPISFTIALIGSFSMAGLPPFNGFLSKEMFFTAALNIKELSIFSLNTWGLLFPMIAWIASVFTFVYCMIIVFKTFLGDIRDKKIKPQEKLEPAIGMLVAPGFLAILVVLIFFFPNKVGHLLITPAMASIYPIFKTTDLVQSISAWHGFNTELLMTFGVVLVGSGLYLSFRYWKGIYTLLPTTLSLDVLYNKSLLVLEKGSSRLTKLYMTGLLRDYVFYIFLFFVLATGGTLIYTGAFSFDTSGLSPITGYEWIFVLLIMTAGIAIIFAKSRITAILFNGIIGFSIAFFFVLFRAPDLALTQTIIETITTALFLLCFYFLPEWKKEQLAAKTKVTNILISISVGVVFILVGISVLSGKLFDTISYYFENAYEHVGGKNIVNAILSDYRAFDTMLEVIVLFMVGIGVYALLKTGRGRSGHNIEDQ